ncbi:glycosyltransferase family 2 protein [Tenuifilum thalassicum]|uniref:Glycosyltransferase family 2 protein n=1 Tax=Tenuifilum thalassicum TaxID=2590900 RepID=A0A7D3XWQ9_9BACT|nr:glycosyltransferase family 2 protein [Tenuifilum thalassicum]QKG80571.1 glycosyltransferase family 2 protein [Tenuifilum thalassicum]
MIIEYLFWTGIFIIAYTYFGYPLLLGSFCALKKVLASSNKNNNNSELPPVTIVTAAYNEENHVESKIENNNQIDYPKDKITQLWVENGSTDKTLTLLKKHSDIVLITTKERLGKAESLNNAVQKINTPIVILTDANTTLSKNSVKDLVKHFTNPKVGCVAGRKMVKWSKEDSSASKGEGFYWIFESFLKKMESCTGTTISGAGELYAIRTELFKTIDSDTILDDFAVSSKIIEQGYQIKYEPNAIAQESGSLTIEDERKRKIRIAAGSFQLLSRHLSSLISKQNIDVSFKFISHKLLRWIAVPPFLILLPVLNAFIIAMQNELNAIYIFSMFLFGIFYLWVLVGFILRNKKSVPPIIILPYYGFMMNISMFEGFIRYLGGKQNYLWEKANRKVDKL